MEENKNTQHKLSEADLALLNFASQNNLNAALVGKPKTFWKDIVLRFFQNKFAVFALIVFLVVFLMSIFVPIFSPYSSTKPISTADVSLVQKLPSSIGNKPHRVLISSDFLDILKNLEANNPGTKIILESQRLGNQVRISYYPYLALSLLSPTKQQFSSIIGTDSFGRDLWLTSWEGTRNALLLGFIVGTIQTFIGIIVGTYMGFHIGKKVDNILMRVIEIINSIPWFLIFIILVQILGTDYLSIGIILIVLGWTNPTYVARSYTSIIKDEEFLYASKVVGASKLRIIYLEALPQIIGKLTNVYLNRIIGGIFALSSLAFLQLIFDNPSLTPNLGLILNNSIRLIDENIWAIILPSSILAIIVITLKITFTGLHDALDPKTKKVS